VGLRSSLNVIGAGMGWRTVGLPSWGATLLRAFATGDEQDRMLAGMSLVKAGERSIDLIERAVASGTAPPSAVRLIADIGGERARASLREIAATPGAYAGAAQEGLDQLARADAVDDQ
jgi:Flp pilus assembly protein TadB